MQKNFSQKRRSKVFVPKTSSPNYFRSKGQFNRRSTQGKGAHFQINPRKKQSVKLLIPQECREFSTRTRITQFKKERTP